MVQKSVLISDDDVHVTAALARLFRAGGYDVITDLNSDVVELAVQKKPSLILLDLIQNTDDRESHFERRTGALVAAATQSQPTTSRIVSTALRQLEFASTKDVRCRKTQPSTSPAAFALKDEDVFVLLKRMAQAIVAVARSGREDRDERFEQKLQPRQVDIGATQRS